MPALLLSAAALFTLCTSAPRETCVIDGDTFWLAGEKVRIADINAPETAQAECASERQRGEAAKLRLLQLLNQGPGGTQPRSLWSPSGGGNAARGKPGRATGGGGPGRALARAAFKLVRYGQMMAHKQKAPALPGLSAVQCV